MAVVKLCTTIFILSYRQSLFHREDSVSHRRSSFHVLGYFVDSRVALFLGYFRILPTLAGSAWYSPVEILALLLISV